MPAQDSRLFGDREWCCCCYCYCKPRRNKRRALEDRLRDVPVLGVALAHKFVLLTLSEKPHTYIDSMPHGSCSGSLIADTLKYHGQRCPRSTPGPPIPSLHWLRAYTRSTDWALSKTRPTPCRPKVEHRRRKHPTNHRLKETKTNGNHVSKQPT